uniref:Probable cytosolic iron-sulfur protein assembly protein 1 n=1 Tax=Kwoniella bestiolae CBS 10118 TaxID=1296100 RepID=A0A1B9G415_9TREE|nr:WD40 repeat protein Ciao1 [Kwoniella bestiolae CBS 10118]OCF25751.1 WD40 repeat protein Ciao1 [Kwoniella bestiolae CBS 10118]
MPQLQLIAELPSHSEPAWAVTFNPTRSLLASCSTDRSIRLFSYILPSSPSADNFPSSSDPKPVFSLNKVVSTDHKRTVRSIAWSPDGRTLASGSFDSTVGVWEEVIPSSDNEDEDQEGVYKPDVEGEDSKEEKEWECVTTLEGHESECKSVAFSSDGALLASCSRDKSVWVWEVQPDADFECIAVMMEHSQDVKCIAWHPHEEILASASYDSHIHLAFDDPDSDWMLFQKLHAKLPPTPLTLSHDSPASLINALIPSPTVWSLAFSPDGGYLASGGDLGGIRIWKRQGNQPDSTWTEVLHLAVHTRSIFSLAWSPSPSPSPEPTDLGLLASAGGDGKIVVFQLTSFESGVSMKPLAAIKDAHGVSDVNSVGWCIREDKKGLGILSSAGDDGSVKVWRLVSDV